MEPIPTSHQAYVEELARSPLVTPFASMKPAFALVEIESLLAYQFHLELPRSQMLAGSAKPTLDEMFRICLPHHPEAVPYRCVVQTNGVLVESRSLNLRMLGMLDPKDGAAGIAFGSASPLVQVAQFNGRAYLRNGFHRAYALRKRGATHMPSMLLHPKGVSELGARGNGETFGLPLLESANPPSVGHYCQDRAYELPIRVGRRMIQATWTEYVLLEPD